MSFNTLHLYFCCFWLLQTPLNGLLISVKKSESLVRMKRAAEHYEDTFPLSEARKQEFVDYHNKYRRLVNPSASNMREMSWDEELAQLATNYSKNCNFNHNTDENRKTSMFSIAGENIFGGDRYAISQIFEKVPEEWYNEIVDYTYATTSCAANKFCGHYTQLAWADTYKVGCTIAICSQIENGHGKNLVICNYGPAGNAYEGNTALPPYRSGNWCTACPANHNCIDKLCSPIPPNTTMATATTTVTTTIGLQTTLTPINTPTSIETANSTQSPLIWTHTRESSGSMTASGSQNQKTTLVTSPAVQNLTTGNTSNNTTGITSNNTTGSTAAPVSASVWTVTYTATISYVVHLNLFS